MSEKPNYRHSFLNPERTEKDKIVVNRFGHTILGGQLEDHVLPHEEMDVLVDPTGDIVATRKAEIYEHPAVKRWAINAGIDPSVFMKGETLAPDADAPKDIAEAPSVERPRSLFDHLPSSLDELARESRADNPMDGFPAAPRLNRSSPQEVQITLPVNLGSPRPATQAPASNTSITTQHCSGCQGNHPVNARFCPHCGMALSRFCIHCGYQFAGSEKFCPDCGERR